MNKTSAFLLFVFLLSSCTPAATGVPTSAPQSISPILTSTPELIATPTPSPTETLIPTPTQIGGGSGRLIFSYSSSEFKKDFPDLKGDGDVFIANIDGSNLTPITKGLDGANNLISVSPDGTKALLYSLSSSTPNLYVVDLNALEAEPIKLATKSSSARWLDDTRIVYSGQGDKGYGIYIINKDGTNPINIARTPPSEILASNTEYVYWNTWVDRPQGNRHFLTYYLWWTKLDGSETGKLTYKGEQIGTSSFNVQDAVFSPNGAKLAWVEAATATFHHNYLHIASLSDLENPLSIDMITPTVDLKWRLDGKSLLVFDVFSVAKSDSNSNNYGFYEVSAESGTILKNYHLPDNLMGGYGGDILPMQCSDISLDNQWLPCLTFTTEKNPNGLQIGKLNLLNLETGVVSELNGFSFLFMSFDARKISWIP